MNEADIRELLAKLDELERATLTDPHTQGFRHGVNYVAEGMRETLSNMLYDSFLQPTTT